MVKLSSGGWLDVSGHPARTHQPVFGSADALCLASPSAASREYDPHAAFERRRVQQPALRFVHQDFFSSSRLLVFSFFSFFSSFASSLHFTRTPFANCIPHSNQRRPARALRGVHRFVGVSFAWHTHATLRGRLFWCGMLTQNADGYAALYVVHPTWHSRPTPILPRLLTICGRTRYCFADQRCCSKRLPSLAHTHTHTPPSFVGCTSADRTYTSATRCACRAHAGLYQCRWQGGCAVDERRTVCAGRSE